jgi:hypothetical protein
LALSPSAESSLTRGVGSNRRRLLLRHRRAGLTEPEIIPPIRRFEQFTEGKSGIRVYGTGRTACLFRQARTAHRACRGNRARRALDDHPGHRARCVSDFHPRGWGACRRPHPLPPAPRLPAAGSLASGPGRCGGSCATRCCATWADGCVRPVTTLSLRQAGFPTAHSPRAAPKRIGSC